MTMQIFALALMVRNPVACVKFKAGSNVHIDVIKEVILIARSNMLNVTNNRHYTLTP
jgi:hypothetical protein